MRKSPQKNNNNNSLSRFDARADKNKIEISGISISGPLPDPFILEKYEAIYPGTAERVIKMAEKEQDHRIDIQKTALDASKKDSFRGQLFAFIISMAGILGAITCAILDQKTIGAAMTPASLAVLIASFYRKKLKKNTEPPEQED